MCGALQLNFQGPSNQWHPGNFDASLCGPIAQTAMPQSRVGIDDLGLLQERIVAGRHNSGTT